ncbi:type II secretion system protein [Patescibacteria group bacterium]
MKSAFTLVELIMVMAVLAVMAVFVLNVFPSGRARAEDSVVKNEVSQYQIKLEQYANINDGVYPIGGGTVRDVCPQLDTHVCNSTEADNYNYITNLSGTAYYIWAQIKETSTSGDVQYYVACSDGARGETTTEPLGNDCPI